MSTGSSQWDGMSVMRGRRAYADTPMGQVHYAILGDGAPMLLLHQTPWFSVQYATAQPLLAAGGLKTIAVDTPGYGRSDRPDHAPTIAEYADNLIALLDELKLDRATVVGHHTGACIAAAFAARHPARCSAAALHGPPLYTPEERADRIANQLHPNTDVASDGSHLTARWTRVQSRFAPNAPPASLNWSVLAFALAGRLEWYGHAAAFHFDMADALQEITAPTLIMSNTADTVHQAAARALALRPDFAYHEFAGGSPHMIYDDPEPWAAAILRFLKSHGLAL